jgi:hypothetical protein
MFTTGDYSMHVTKVKEKLARYEGHLAGHRADAALRRA